jgi:hypothetical protein
MEVETRARCTFFDEMPIEVDVAEVDFSFCALLHCAGMRIGEGCRPPCVEVAGYDGCAQGHCQDRQGQYRRRHYGLL